MGNTVSTAHDPLFDTKLCPSDRTAVEGLVFPPLPPQRELSRELSREPVEPAEPVAPSREVPTSQLLVVKRQSQKHLPKSSPRAVTQPERAAPPLKTVEPAPAPAQRIANSWRRSVDPYMRRTYSCPHASPVIDFDQIPVLQPDTDSDIESQPSPASFGSDGFFEGQAVRVRIYDSSPKLSHYGSVHYHDDFDFLETPGPVPSPEVWEPPVSPPSPRRPQLLRRATSPSPGTVSRTPSSVYSALSVRSNRSASSTRSELVRQDSLDAGIPPMVPAHTVFRGRPASTVILPLQPPARPRSKSDASTLPFEIYTRKCKLTSPEVSHALTGRLAVHQTPVVSKPAPEHRFALDGYSAKAPLQVVNRDPVAPRKFFVKSKAMIAEEQERLQNQFYARQF